MAIRVPLLLETVQAVISRVDGPATAAFNPPGGPASGYDTDFREPIKYKSGTASVSSLQYKTAIKVACQVEALTAERLREYFPGDSPSSNLIVVISRIDAEAMGILDSTTRKIAIGVNDRVERFEKAGAIVHPLAQPLYVFEVRPASWGFGPDGHDLELLFLNDRPKAV